MDYVNRIEVIFFSEVISMKKYKLILLTVLSLSLLLLTACAGGIGVKENADDGPDKVYDVQKVIITYNLGDIDGAEMDVFTPDGVVKIYQVQPYSDSGIDLFAGEVPPENKSRVKEVTISEDDWNSIVAAINDNKFMKLPEELPEVEAMDGSTSYIIVETTEGTHKSGGYCAGNGSGKKHKRYSEVKKVLFGFTK